VKDRREEVLNVLVLLEAMTNAGTDALNDLIDAPDEEKKEVLCQALALRADLRKHLDSIEDA